MMILKITPPVEYNKCLKRLDTKQNEPTNQNSLKVPKVVKPNNKKTIFKTLGTSVINRLMSPPSQNYYLHIIKAALALGGTILVLL